jgi:hypothetical protein
MRMARKMTAKIGAVLPLSGPLARVGEQAKIGVDLAATEINAAGGILQASVEIGYRDNRSDPATADAQARALIDQQVIAIVGPVSSAMRDAMAPTMARHKTPLLAWPRHRLLSGKADIKSQAKPTDWLDIRRVIEARGQSWKTWKSQPPGTTFGLRTLPCSSTLMGIFFLDSLPRCSSGEIW